MKFTVLSDTFSRAAGLVAVAAAAAAGTVYDWTTNIHLTAEPNGQLRLLACDGAIAQAQWAGAIITIPGQGMFPAAKLVEVLANAPAGVNLECTLTPTFKLKIVGLQAGFRTELAGFDPASFSIPPVVTPDGALQMPGAQLVDLFMQVKSAASRDAVKPMLTGVHFLLRNGQLLLETADGFRMHRALVAYASTKTIDVTIPLSGIDSAIRCIDRAEAVHLLFVERGGAIRRVVFIQDTMQLTCNSLEGNYPDISAIIPKKSAVTATLASDVLLACLHRAAVMTPKTKMVSLTFKPGVGTGPGRLEVHSEDTDQSSGKHDETLSAAISAPLAISVNIAYLTQLVRAADQSVVQLQLNTPTSPLMIQHPSFTGVTMPMQPPVAKPKAQ